MVSTDICGSRYLNMGIFKGMPVDDGKGRVQVPRKIAEGRRYESNGGESQEPE